MDVGTVAMMAIGLVAAGFVIFAYYWWEVRPVSREDNDKS
jgi:hypothetical protein